MAKKEPVAKADNSNSNAYECLGIVDHNGERFDAGQAITLSDSDAAPLLEVKAIKAAD